MGWEMLPPEQPIWVSRCCPKECVEELEKLKFERDHLRKELTGRPSKELYEATIKEYEVERDRLRKTLQEIKEELEYDISNGKVALDLALAALEDK